MNLLRCSMLLLTSLGLAGCTPRSSSESGQPAADKQQLQATIDDLRQQLTRATEQANQLRQELAVSRQREEAALAAEQQRRQEAEQQRRLQQERAELAKQLAAGALTTAQVQALLAPGKASRQRVQELLGPPEEARDNRWVYRRGPIQDAVVLHKQYTGFSIEFTPAGLVRDLVFHP